MVQAAKDEMASGLSPAEQKQLEQTVAMFETIVQSQPYDCQSLEILKEAYAKLGRHKDVLRTSKRLANSYLQLGQLSSAILEYEAVVHADPNDLEAREALAKIERQAQPALDQSAPVQAVATSPPRPEPVAPLEQPVSAAPTLTIEPVRPAKPAPEPAEKPETTPRLAIKEPPPPTTLKPAVKIPPAPAPHPAAPDRDDGRNEVYRIFVESKLVAPADFELYWPVQPAVTTKIIEPFIQVLADQKLVPIETSLKTLIEHSRVPFIPLDRYDIDFDLARRFPAQVCQRWCVLPFDRMSRTTFVATANPFNKTALNELAVATTDRLIYYLAMPADLIRAIKKAFRL